MSRFASQRLAGMEPYAPGEQPGDLKYIKLNTNESPFPPSESVRQAVAEASGRLQLYSDPECKALNQAVAAALGVKPEQLLMSNGSDEILNFAFAAFGDANRGFAFPGLTYGFYPVFAGLNQVPFRKIPLKPDFSVDPKDYKSLGMNIVIANPNAPTGLTLTPAQVENIVASNPDHVVVIDEAYVDFGGKTVLPLIEKYENLLVTRTFSKSYSLAGARLGFGAGNPALIKDLNAVKYSSNPYNVNAMTMAAGIAAMTDRGYYRSNCETIIANREQTKSALRSLGFAVTDSAANFLFAAHPQVEGVKLYRKLKERGILIRHFSDPAIENYNRITIGTREQMKLLLEAIECIVKEGGTP